MEAEQGNDVTFINPKPGVVLKTSFLSEFDTPLNSKENIKKVFINLCSAPEIDVAKCKNAKKSDGKRGVAWDLPYSLSAPKQDFDSSQNPCVVYDCVIHPDTFKMAQSNEQFSNMIVMTAIEAYKTLKMKKKSNLSTTIIRKPRKETKDNSSGEKIIKTEEFLNSIQNKLNVADLKPPVNGHSEILTPNFKIIEQGEIDLGEFTNEVKRQNSRKRPTALVLKIDLPLVDCVSEVDLDTSEESVSLTVPKKYKLDVALPYPVIVDDGNAKFDKSKKQLSVRLPVIQIKPLIEEISSINLDSVGPVDASENEIQNSERNENNKVIEECTHQKSDEDDKVVKESTCQQSENESALPLAKDLAPFTQKQTPNFVILTILVSNINKVSFTLENDILSIPFGDLPFHLSLKLPITLSVSNVKIDTQGNSFSIKIEKPDSEKKKWESIGIILPNGNILERPFLNSEYSEFEEIKNLTNSEQEQVPNTQTVSDEDSEKSSLKTSPQPFKKVLKSSTSSLSGTSPNSPPKHVHFNDQVEVAQITEQQRNRKGRQGSQNAPIKIIKKACLKLEGDEEEDSEHQEEDEAILETDTDTQDDNSESSEVPNECPPSRKVKKRKNGPKKVPKNKPAKQENSKSSPSGVNSVELNNTLMFDLD
ncbi:hypothetical protein HK096_001840 [Nowakowskiella sp. JEL0078]|nr:hypothetical protein HK096_001840 [Nowakowskiella sp. JEL0078]